MEKIKVYTLASEDFSEVVGKTCYVSDGINSIKEDTVNCPVRNIAGVGFRGFVDEYGNEWMFASAYEEDSKLMSNRQLAWWLRKNPDEMRELVFVGEGLVYDSLNYESAKEHFECDECARVRKLGGEWVVPTVKLYKQDA